MGTSSYTGEGYILNALQSCLFARRAGRLAVEWSGFGGSFGEECEAGALQSITSQTLELSVDELLASSMSLYAPHTKQRRLFAWRVNGDRLDMLAIVGNAKLHRRICGSLGAEAVSVAMFGLSPCARLFRQPRAKGSALSRPHRAAIPA